jgi:hypothetical protein
MGACFPRDDWYAPWLFDDRRGRRQSFSLVGVDRTLIR